jgi:hypothetical protein
MSTHKSYLPTGQKKNKMRKCENVDISTETQNIINKIFINTYVFCFICMTFVIMIFIRKKVFIYSMIWSIFFFVNYEIIKKKTGTIISADVKSGLQVFSQLCVENAVQDLSLKC